MTRTSLLALSGPICAGKDTVACVLNQRHDVALMAFGDFLKEEVRRAIDVAALCGSEEEVASTLQVSMSCTLEGARRMAHVLWGEDGSELDRLAGGPLVKTPMVRQALQVWGTEVRRQQDTDYWVRALVDAATSALEEGLPVVVTDARFPNEVEAVRALGGVVVRLDVSPGVQQERALARDGSPVSPEARSHASERSLEGCSFDLEVNTDPLTPQQVADAIEDLGIF